MTRGPLGGTRSRELETTDPMKKTILFLEQQSWLSGAQRVLEAVMDAVSDDFQPVVAFPGSGDFCSKLAERQIATTFYPLGSYQSGEKPLSEKLIFCFRSLLSGLRLAAFARRRGVALIYINGPRCLPAGVLASWIAGCPALFHLHLTLTRPPEIALVARLARFVSKIIVCSHAAARPLLDANPRLAEKVCVLYNPVFPRAERSTVHSASPESPSSVTFGMVCRTTEFKGQQMLLEAAGALSATHKEKIRLIFMGAPAPNNSRDAAYATRLRLRAKELGLENKVLWAGYQTTPDPLFTQMDALIVASWIQAGEGMPIVVLEALQRGIPVIASRTGGVPEVVQDGWNGLLVSPRDVKGLAQALERFLADRSLREHLRAGARTGLDERFSMAHFKSNIKSQLAEFGASLQPRHKPATAGECAA